MSIYVVKKGDTLFAIAKTFGVSLDKLVQINPQIKNPDEIFPGDKINIPAKGNAPPDYLERQPEADFEYSISQLAKKFPDTFYLKGNRGSNRIALTFDDGPDKRYTPQILDVLKEHNLPSTFFLLGSMAEKYPEVVERIVNENHVIGNHSWSHPDLRKLSSSRLADEILKTENILKEIVGLRTSLVRPPYGAVTKNVLEELKKMGYKVINWSVDSVDWRDRDPAQILKNTLPDVTAEAILLFHSAGGPSIAGTVEVLPELIATLRKKGYTFVSVDELLGIAAYRQVIKNGT